MKASKELVQHISTTFRDKSNKEIAQCLEDFKGNPLKEEETPIELSPLVQPTIHTSKPSDVTLEKRVKALENKAEKTRLELIYIHQLLGNAGIGNVDTLSDLPTKPNLSIDIPSIYWKEIFERENTVINCETEQEANKLLKIANELGYKWRDGDKFTQINDFLYYQNKTCYNIKKGMYQNFAYYTDYGYTILRYRDIIAGK
jgi:hypothetical protein